MLLCVTLWTARHTAGFDPYVVDVLPVRTKWFAKAFLIRLECSPGICVCVSGIIQPVGVTEELEKE